MPVVPAEKPSAAAPMPARSVSFGTAIRAAHLNRQADI
jgi:hypothetical protein